jgi:hypothetical protein
MLDLGKMSALRGHLISYKTEGLSTNGEALYFKLLLLPPCAVVTNHGQH